jgi:hypothetical protein
MKGDKTKISQFYFDLNSNSSDVETLPPSAAETSEDIGLDGIYEKNLEQSGALSDENE